MCEGESVTGVIEESDRSIDCIAGVCCLINICRRDWASSRRVTIWAFRIAFSCSSIVALKAICVRIKRNLYIYKGNISKRELYSCANLLKCYRALLFVKFDLHCFLSKNLEKKIYFCSYVILPDFASISRLLCRLIVPFTSLVIFFILLFVRDRFLFASGSFV